MKSNLEKLLREDFGDILDCCLNIEVGDGWYTPIACYLELLQQYIKRKKLKQTRVVIMRSVGGTLNVCVKNPTPTITKMTKNLKLTCFSTCEVCGKAGELDKEITKVVCKKHGKG